MSAPRLFSPIPIKLYLLSINFYVGLIRLFGSSAPAAIVCREGAVALGATLYVLFPALPMVCREPDIGGALDVLIPTFWVAPGPCLSRFVVRCSVTSSVAEVSLGRELCLRFFALVSSRTSSLPLRPCSPCILGCASCSRGL
jgi:hypothetical protein